MFCKRHTYIVLTLTNLKSGLILKSTINKNIFFLSNQNISACRLDYKQFLNLKWISSIIINYFIIIYAYLLSFFPNKYVNKLKFDKLLIHSTQPSFKMMSQSLITHQFYRNKKIM